MHRYKYIRMYTFGSMYVYIYIYIYVYMRHRAWRVWCGRVSNFTFRLLLSDFCVLLIQGGSVPLRPIARAWQVPPRDASLPTSLLLYVLPNVHYFPLCIHHILHENLICCFANIDFFTFLQKNRISQFTQKPNAKEESIKNTRISINIDQPGPHTSPPEVTFSASYFHRNLKMPYWNH